MDFYAAMEILRPGAKYGGVAINPDEYENIRWEDERSKPTWNALETVDTDLPGSRLHQKENLIHAAMRLAATERNDYKAAFAAIDAAISRDEVMAIKLEDYATE